MVAGLLVGMLFATASASGVTPSDNDTNRENGWAHFNVLDARVGEVEIEFVSTRTFFSCFEYRSDGDTSEQINPANPNDEVDDAQYPFVCVNNSTAIRTLTATEYVEVRMVFGAERDERFDWTRVDVLPDAQAKDDCMKGGWQDFGFKNQGQCIQFVNTGKDGR